MTQAHDDADVVNAQVRNLDATAAKLLDQAAAGSAGRAALTLVAGAGAPLKQTCWRSGAGWSWPSTRRLARPP
jgi:hypothetical protein